MSNGGTASESVSVGPPPPGASVCVTRGFYEGLEVPVDREWMVIGRGRSADFVIAEPTISRSHAALGYDAAPLTAAVQPKGSMALVQYFEQLAEADCPYGVFGYAYALERGALFRKQQDIEAIQALVRPGLDITRCLRVHSAVGSDREHVAELVAFIAGLSRDNRQTVLEAAYQTAKLMSAHKNADFDAASFKAQLARAALA